MSQTVTADATFTRPADTTAYASGDLVANSTTAGSVVAMSLTYSRNSASLLKIKRVHISKTTNTITVSSFRVHFYTASPASTNGDNAAYASGTQASYLGYIDVNVGQGMATGASSWGAAVIGSEPASIITGTGSLTLYALIEARAAYVPGNAEVFTCRVEVEQAEPLR